MEYPASMPDPGPISKCFRQGDLFHGAPRRERVRRDALLTVGQPSRLAAGASAIFFTERRDSFSGDCHLGERTIRSPLFRTSLTMA